MGKRNFKGNKGGNRGGGRGGGRSGGRRGVRADYKEVVKANELFEKYYNGISTETIPEEEKEEFWKALRRELPNSFRFTGSKGHALSVQKQLVEHYIPEITSIKYEGEFVEPPKPVEWYPDHLAWSMTTPKNIVRRFPPFSSFQKFLVSETSVGNISRQEVVSMIPPLLLDVRPGMTVLDLCAAPGSKSAQLLEMVHTGEEARVRSVLRKMLKQQDRELSPDGVELEEELEATNESETYEDSGRATGLLIANDADYKRSHLLIHQIKRLNSPNIIITNHDATLYPSIRIKEPEDATGRHRYLKFDRILADVPCSGDGTARKNPNVWRDWNPGNALGLYVTQTRILVRALQMLKVGGRVVYSTCSMNPIEDEAVISSAIRRCGGSANVEIIDCGKSLPGLKYRQGLKSWQVMDKQGRIWSSWKDVEAHKEKEGIEGLGRLAEGMFPVTEEEVNLDRSIRIYPHLQDTGGFFICVLEKKSEIKAKPENGAKIVPKIAEKVEAAKADEKLDAAVQVQASVGQDTDQDEVVFVPRNKQDDQHISVETEPSKTAPQQPAVKPHTNAESPKHKLEDDEDDIRSSAKRLKLDEERTQPVDAPEKKAVCSPPPSGTSTHKGPDNETYTPLKSANQSYEEPFKYLDPDHEQLQLIYKFYTLSSLFPRDRFMVRNAAGTPAKTIYYTSALAREILVQNEGKGIKFVHCGVKMFVKQDVQREGVCPWRIQTDGLPILEAWIGEERIVRLYKQQTLKKLLVEMFPKISGDGWTQLGEIGERAKDIPMGCCVLKVEPTDAQDGFRERMVLPLWRSLYSFNLMLPKEERKAMLLRLYNDETPLVDNHVPRKNASDTPMPDAAATPADSKAGGDDPESEKQTTPIKEAAAAVSKTQDEKQAVATDSVSKEDVECKLQNSV